MRAMALIFFVIAAVSAFLAYGGVTTAFAGIATIIFFISLVLLIGALLLSFLPVGFASGSLRGAGLLILGAVIGVGGYLWIENGMSAERVGRSIDRSAVQLADETKRAADDTADFVEATWQDARQNAEDANKRPPHQE